MTEDETIKRLIDHSHFLVGVSDTENIASALLVHFGVFLPDSDIATVIRDRCCLVCAGWRYAHTWVRHAEFESWWAGISPSLYNRRGFVPEFPEAGKIPGPGLPPKSTVTRLFNRLPFALPKGFRLGDIHFVEGIGPLSGRIGLTDVDGSTEAFLFSMWVVNVADEIDSAADAKIPLDPSKLHFQSNMRSVLDAVEEGLRQRDGKVVIHSALGMERGPLAVYWYLHSRVGLSKQLAWDAVVDIRPVVVDRRDWLTQPQ